MKHVCKKVLCILLCLSSALFSFACGEGKKIDFGFTLEEIMDKYDASLYAYDGDPVTLSMSHWDAGGSDIERQVVEAVLEGFEKRYPTIKVNLEIIPGYEQNYASNIASGQLHDVFLVPDGMMAIWAGGGKMMNLESFIAASELIDDKEIMASVLDRYRYNPQTNRTGSGDILCLPKDVGPQVMYYNKDAFDALGVAYPPADRIMTIEEATEMWKKLTTKNSSGSINRYGVAGLGMEGLVWSAGGDFLNPDRSAFPTDPATVAALKKAYQYMQDAYLKYKVQPPAEFVSGQNPAQLFSSQRVSCLISGRWEVAAFRELSFDWDIAYAPAFDANPTKNYWSGSVAYAVNNGLPASKKFAAWKLVEYIASKEGQEILTATGFQIPVYEDLGKDEVIIEREKALGPENYSIFIDSAKYQPSGLWQYLPNQQWKVDGYDLLSENLFNATNPLSVDTFLENVKRVVNSKL